MRETRPPSPDSSAPVARQPSRAGASAIAIDVSALSHPGLVRPNNEDQFFVSKQTRSLETMLTSLPAGDVPKRVDDFSYLMMVADGMGGHAAGEVASRMVISSLIRLTLDIPD